MPEIHGEVEFEFVESAGSAGKFMAVGRVAGMIKSNLAKGEVQGAADLYSSCQESVGDALIEEVKTASKAFTQGLLEMFITARDFNRAARLCEMTHDFRRAAEFFEASYELDKAAEYYLKANLVDKAADIYERNLDFAKAGELFFRAKNFDRAASNFEKAGQYYNSGQLYLKMAKFQKAVELLQKIQMFEKHFVKASLLLSDVLERSGGGEMAVNRYYEIASKYPLDADTVEFYYRLARCYHERGMQAEAAEMFGRIMQFDPSFKDTAAAARAIAEGRPAGQPRFAPGPVPAPQPPIPGAQPVREKVTAINADFEFLRKLPLFENLLLDELKSFYALCEAAGFKGGEMVIEQGTAGEALFILRKGTVSVVREAAGKRRGLATLGPGDCFGEMSIFDDGPTSASIIADGETSAFRIRKKSFLDFLAANERVALRIYKMFVSTLIRRLRATSAQLSQK